MDSKIRSYPATEIFNGHNLCDRHGIIYQRDVTRPVEYADDYFENYQRYEDSPIADALNEFRIGFVDRYVYQGVLDVGIGCGTFLDRCGRPKMGYDINLKGVSWLKERDLYFDPYQDEIPDWIEGVTLWDVLEHMPNPDLFLNRIPSGVYLFVSIPIFHSITKVRSSKHFKPDEHYYYFSHGGFSQYMEEMGFSKIWFCDDESRIGREDIMSFVFTRNV